MPQKRYDWKDPLRHREGTTLRSRTSLTIRLDRKSRVALHRQLYDALRDAIVRGGLAPGMLLPSTRADEPLFVNRYGEPLTASGFRFRLRQYCQSGGGRGADAAAETDYASRVSPYDRRSSDLRWS